MAHELNPNQENSFLEIGRLLGENAYKREKKEITVGNMKIDLIRKDNGEAIIGETKKSSRFENSARMQLAFYLHRLKKRGIEAKGELLIPKEEKRIPVQLTEEIQSEPKGAFSKIERIMEQSSPPEPIKVRYCTNCAYRKFCWV